MYLEETMYRNEWQTTKSANLNNNIVNLQNAFSKTYIRSSSKSLKKKEHPRIRTKESSLDQGIGTSSEPDTPPATITGLHKLNQTEILLRPIVIKIILYDKTNNIPKFKSITAKSKAATNVEKIIKETATPIPINIESDKLSGDETRIEKTRTEQMREQVARIGEYQRTLLKETFHNILERNISQNGLNIMIRLFSEHPHYKAIWPQFRQIPDSSLMNATELSKHAVVYMNGLKYIINAMDDDEKLSTALKKITQAHIKWKIHKSHIMNMLDPLLSIIKAGSEKQDKDVEQAWTILFDVISDLIEIFRKNSTSNQ